MISSGEVITSEQRMDDFVEVMLGDRFPIDFDLGNSPYDASNLAYWPYYLITAGEVISDAGDAHDFLAAMMGYEDDYDGEMGVFEGYGDYDTPEWDEPDYEPDVDEAQEWHDYDPDC